MTNGEHSQTTADAAIDQQYNGTESAVVGYDDHQGNSATGRSNVSPTQRSYDLGISGGVDYLVDGWAINDYRQFIRQTSHSVKLSTIIDEHIHYMTPTDGTGSKFKIQVDVAAAGVMGNFTAAVGSPFTAEIDITEDLTNKHMLSDLCEIPAMNDTVSSLFFVKVTRIDASADEYSGEIYILFSDGHTQIDQERGSLTESTKYKAGV